MSSDQDDQAKKISEEEKRQSREIVLEAIGEKKATAADLEAESKVEKKATDTFFGFKFGKEKEEREEVKIAKTVKPEEGR
ncbi:MAG: hypothetical protein NTW06_01850, partial [Candidatus Falkowbacteria bacterium]|nr:hypothetical protein [Candidatus Falkowbacteria bacterium]